MADEAARRLQYEYKLNSNLVINPNKDLIEKIDRNEPTGEVLPLTANEIATRMGDRYQRTRPKLLDDKEHKPKKVKTTSVDDQRTSKYELNKFKGQSILSEDFEDSSSILYRPKTQETRQTYEIILSFIQECIGDQPRDVLCGAADEVLITLKNDRLKDKERKREVEGLLGNIPDERFNQLVNLGKKITDWSNEQLEKSLNQEGLNQDEMDETIGVKVMIEDEDDEEDEENEVNEINEEEDEDEDEEEKEELQEDHVIQGKLGNDAIQAGSKAKSLQPHEIDAFWLQRKLSKIYDDPTQAQHKVKEVLEILKEASDERDVENQLVLLLGFDQFEFIKLLRSKRQMILYCTLLASAQSAEEKKNIEEKMRGETELAEILEALQRQTDKVDLIQEERDRRAALRKSKMDVDEEMEEQGGKVESDQWNPKQVINLEDIAFAQGGHLMANKKCQLPEGSFRKQKKGYEEVHVPASKPRPIDPDSLVPIENLPRYAQPAFEGVYI